MAFTSLGQGADDPCLRCDNCDAGRSTPAGGHGLRGIRERAMAVGGELRVGAATVGGFLVEARLPGTSQTGG